MLIKRILGAACALASVMAVAQTKDGGPLRDSVDPSGTCVAIPDNGYVSPATGTTGMTCKTIAVPAGTINNPTIQLGLTHTWIGDLTVKVVPPSGSPIVTLFNRPGVPTTAAGDSTDLINTSPLSFADAFTDDPETMGNTLSTSQVACLNDARCNYRTNRDAETGSTATNLAALNGQAAAGNWQVCVGDSAGLDTGSICAVTITAGSGGGGGGATYTVTPTAHNFGNVAVGVTSATVTSTVANTTAAGGASMQVTGCTFGGANAADFSFATAPTFPVTINAQANSALNLRFIPGAAGARAGTLTCNTNTTPASFVLNLTGTGANPQFASNPAPASTISLQAGVGAAAGTSTIVVSNAGNAALTVTCTAVAPFSVTPSPLTVAAGGSGNLVVGFLPNRQGPFSSTLTCTTNAAAPLNNVSYNLIGTGFSLIAVPSSNWMGQIALFGLLAGLGLFAFARRKG
jgi:subtilisin-like proprotein convertase family protein